ncbi:ribosomal RNA-processing protein 8 [Onthophagus taurus]|uniref:ribosomal RNA-processing protein 8 n=1 Tax=Onthophagus taurus TaxID=166361 RepID=UPI0039BE2668
MDTFKTPKWDNSEVSDEKIKNLFKKKKKKSHRSKASNESVSSKKKEKNKKPKNNLPNKPENPSKQLKINQKKLTQNQVVNQKRKIKSIENKNSTSGGKSNEYHTLLKSRKEFMKLSLRERMMERLKSSRFRYINEELYTIEGKSAKDMFKKDPKAFQAYHEGYRQQVNKWPINPLDVIIKSIKKMDGNKIVADMGCGEAKLSQSVPQKVYSFDLQAVNDYVTECEMSKVPLEKNSVDVVVFCLSLMGTNIKDFIFEANRILKIGGTLKIAEVQSRFEKVDVFIKGIEQFGFKQSWKDLTKDLFYFIDFKKMTECRNKNKLPSVGLLPCLYKKR